MNRKKNTGRTKTIAVNSDQLPAPNPEGQAVLDALRSNQNLLGELAARYEVSLRPEGPENPPTVNRSQDIYDILGPEMSALAQEQLRVLLLNTSNEVIGQRVIYQGNVNSSMVRAAEVFRPAVVENAPTVVVVHNHPSGNPDPSPNDVTITRSLKRAAELLDIELFDHVVIGGRRHVSLKNRGLMGT